MPDPRDSLQQALSTTYRLERELARGGMAVVYLAQDLKHQRRVALKVIRSDLTYPEAIERFTREIRLAARLQHPHILPVHDSGETGGQLWYTMPFVDGESLRDRLDREGSLPVADAIRIARQSAQALAYAHQHSVIHRDIKPENLLLTKDGSVLVADFGIARAIAGPTTTTSQPGAATRSSAQLTETGMAVGTPAYMAPEARLGAPADTRSDIYSLAAVLYEMLTGRMVVGGDGGFDLVLQQISRTGPGIRVLRPEVPRELEAAVQRGLQLDPAMRYASMEEFAAAMTGSPVPSSGNRRSRYVMPLIIAGTIVVSSVLLWGTLRSKASHITSLPGSVAVLPFQNVSGDTAEAYFAQGMADELTTSLAQLPGLKVAGQSAVARLKPGDQDLAHTGRELDVATILSGSVRRSGGRLRITVQLVSAADGVVLWADRYDRQMGDIFAVQDDITRSIASALEPRLAQSVQTRLAASHTADLAAYDLYLKGRYFWSRRGREGLNKAVQYFNEAVAIDPGFARAHAGLSMAYVVLPVFDSIQPASALARAERSAGRALGLDSSLAEAHLALAYVLKNRWQFAESEREFKSALALAPNDAAVHHWYGVMLYAVGRVEESVERLARARELDPFGSTIATDGAVALYGSRRFAESRRELERSYQLDSTKSDTHFMIALVELVSGRPDSALRWLASARRLGTGFDVRSYESVANRRLGRARQADSLFAAVRNAYVRGATTTPYDLAIAATAAGDRPAAMEAINRTMQAKSMIVTELTLPCDPLLDPLKSDPRFERLLQSVGMRMCPAA
jgi:eukaryotic-like serine/threonine-protein kinase